MSIIVSCSRGHNASTTLLVNGEIIFYLEEERLSRWKRDGTPLLGLTKVFDYVLRKVFLLSLKNQKSNTIFLYFWEHIQKNFHHDEV